MYVYMYMCKYIYIYMNAHAVIFVCVPMIHLQAVSAATHRCRGGGIGWE